MIKKVQGIVISEQDYSESSKIINIITKEYGLIGVIAKGAKRMKSSLRSVSGKLTYGYFHIYYKEDKLSDLISVDVINPFRNIKSDIMKISYTVFIIDLVKQLIREEYSEEIYDLLINAILKIEEGYDPLVITNILELKLLDYLGVRPMVDGCTICGSKTNIITLSGDRGGYICKECYQGEKMVSDKTIKLVRMFYYVDIAKITKLEISDEIKKEINTFIDDYYDRYTGLYLKSKKFLDNLAKL
jgi:DNA repair protein RecO (recombination protein O)